jgi:signal transduction histidine kinase
MRRPDLRVVSGPQTMKAAERGAQMTQQLLTFARKQVLRPEVVNPNEIITNLETFISRAVGANVEVVMLLSLVLRPVQLDRMEFETALVNLALNARDAMNGEGRVVVETRNCVVSDGVSSDVPPGNYVLISISDAGTGMTSEVATRAFKPFFCIHPVTTALPPRCVP